MQLGLPSIRSASGFALLELMIVVPILSIIASIRVVTATTPRRDQCMSLLNTDYGLFRLGSDHQTAMLLSESVGLDGVICANNGGFFGPALNS